MTVLCANTHQALTPLLTPFSDGSIDIEAMEAAIDRQIIAGMDGIVIGDVVGEGHALTSEEFDRLICTAVTRATRHMSVIVAAGSNCTRRTIERCQRAQQLGADALIVTVPYYSKPTRRGVIEHFRQVSACVFIPLIVDDDPQRTGIDHGYPLYEALAEFDIIAGICHGAERLAHMAGMPAHLKHRFLHLTRDDRMLPEMLKVGCGGALSALANILPSPVQMLAGGTPTLSHSTMADVIRTVTTALDHEDIVALKEAASFLYQMPAEPRLPLVAADAEMVVRVRHVFAPFAKGEDMAARAA